MVEQRISLILYIVGEGSRSLHDESRDCNDDEKVFIEFHSSKKRKMMMMITKKKKSARMFFEIAGNIKI
jgi:hypothetical protein